MRSVPAPLRDLVGHRERGAIAPGPAPAAGRNDSAFRYGPGSDTRRIPAGLRSVHRLPGLRNGLSERGAVLPPGTWTTSGRGASPARVGSAPPSGSGSRSAQDGPPWFPGLPVQDRASGAEPVDRGCGQDLAAQVGRIPGGDGPVGPSVGVVAYLPPVGCRTCPDAGWTLRAGSRRGGRADAGCQAPGSRRSFHRPQGGLFPGLRQRGPFGWNFAPITGSADSGGMPD